MVVRRSSKAEVCGLNLHHKTVSCDFDERLAGYIKYSYDRLDVGMQKGKELSPFWVRGVVLEVRDTTATTDASEPQYSCWPTTKIAVCGRTAAMPEF